MAALIQPKTSIDTSINEFGINQDKIVEIKDKITEVCSNLKLSCDDDANRKKLIEILLDEYKDDKMLNGINLNELFKKLMDENGWVKKEKRAKTPRSFYQERSESRASTTSVSSSGQGERIMIRGVRSSFKMNTFCWDDSIGDYKIFVTLDNHFDGEEESEKYDIFNEYGLNPKTSSCQLRIYTGSNSPGVSEKLNELLEYCRENELDHKNISIVGNFNHIRLCSGRYDFIGMIGTWPDQIHYVDPKKGVRTSPRSRPNKLVSYIPKKSGSASASAISGVCTWASRKPMSKEEMLENKLEEAKKMYQRAKRELSEMKFKEKHKEALAKIESEFSNKMSKLKSDFETVQKKFKEDEKQYNASLSKFKADKSKAIEALRSSAESSKSDE